MKKIGLLALAIVLALGTMGIGYALWFDDLTIDGSVETGTFDVDWSTEGEPWDTEEEYGDEKDVSHGDFSIDGNTLYIHIYNAYPCITYSFPIDIHCVGSVPAHFCPIVITGGNLPSGATVTYPDWSTTQLHTDEHAYGTVTVHLDNTATENTDYWFTARLTAYQFNESCSDYPGS